MKIFTAIISFLLYATFCDAQYQEVEHFTIDYGLPSNSIYMTVEDEAGFMWMSTDQGIARFDGRHFQLFGKEQGVPDNEVLTIIKENNGTIWINCLNGSIAYFDKTKNKFIDFTDSLFQNKVKGKKSIYSLPEGGIQINAPLGSYILKNKKLYKYPFSKASDSTYLFKRVDDNAEIRFTSDSKKNKKDLLQIYYVSANKILEKIHLGIDSDYQLIMHEDKLYAFKNESKFAYAFSKIKNNPLQFKKDSILLPQNYYYHNFTKKYIAFLYKDGAVLLLDKNNLTDKIVFEFENFVFNILDDKQQNFWISPFSKGIYLYKVRKINHLNIPAPSVNAPYLCITKTNNGFLLFGNYFGETREIRKDGMNIHKLKNATNTDWLRHIIFSQNKIFTFGERGIFVNYTKEIIRRNNQCKAASVLNDSMILCGYNDGICLLNAKNEKMIELDNGSTFVNSIAATSLDNIYWASREGLFMYSSLTNHCDTLSKMDDRLKNRITSLSITPDNLLFAGTATNGIYILKNNKIIFHITEKNGLITNTIQTLCVGRKKQIWVGTNKGISIINYASSKPSIQNLSTKDGLTSNIINQMFFQNDTMYAATESGISIIPANISIPTFNIPIELTGLKINNKDTIIAKHYSLKANENNIMIQFAGVELTGHFKNAQYSEDEGLTWINIDGSSLSLRFGSGENPLWMRAIDVNGTIGTKILKLQFNIATPIYKTKWFWLLISFLILAASIYINTILTKRKHQRKIDELMNQQALDNLEIQALKAQMNPHFVFNCLNSIKTFIYTKDFDQAEMYLDKFSILLRNTLDYSSRNAISLQSELEYIDSYLTLEKLRYGNAFTYHIHTQHSINQDSITLPAMLLQPYLENALKHGITHLKDKLGEIQVVVSLEENKLYIMIDDNGVGREAATKIKAAKLNTHESKGLSITQRRIELHHIEENIIDKVDEQGHATGTTIHLLIPLMTIDPRSEQDLRLSSLSADKSAPT